MAPAANVITMRTTFAQLLILAILALVAMVASSSANVGRMPP